MNILMADSTQLAEQIKKVLNEHHLDWGTEPQLPEILAGFVGKIISDAVLARDTQWTEWTAERAGER